ncbi:hypothetical protein BU16DRAFT_559412 [Lophium mytilinum]|uniref:Uncharacterized protein n=1 Tax=Lophium mytilinum TaxID=390894 RepID=A0A6A6R1G2_9PEZI|nr:hypothetical protein BU16DRAFT_559412 [Lophium mytilinum]
MSTFSGLFIPVELVYSILDLLPSQSDLASICRVSKEFHSVVSPRLYQSPVVDCGIYINARNAAVWPFLRTVVRRSELGACVKKACFSEHYYEWTYYKMEKETPDIGSEDLELTGTLIVDANLPNPQDWIQAVKDGDPDALIALALCRLSNIEVFEASINSSRQRTFIGIIFEHALNSIRSFPTCFPSLSNIREISVSPKGVFTPLEDAYPLFKIPNLQQVEIKIREVSEWYALHAREISDKSGPNWVWSPFRWPQPNVEFPTIKTLILRQSHLSVTAMRILLAALPNLQELDYDFWGKGTMDYYEPDEAKYPGWLIFGCSPNQRLNFSDGFQPLQDQLEVLRISATVGTGTDDFFDPPPASESSVSTLRQLKALRILSVPLSILLGWDPLAGGTLTQILPPNLEDLEITDTFCDNWDYYWLPQDILPRICDYLTSSSATKLKRLSLGRHSNGHGWREGWRDNDIFDPVRQLCGERGISFIYDLSCHCDEPTKCKSASLYVEDLLEH